jgi:hypothetical protein
MTPKVLVLARAPEMTEARPARIAASILEVRARRARESAAREAEASADV